MRGMALVRPRRRNRCPSRPWLCLGDCGATDSGTRVRGTPAQPQLPNSLTSGRGVGVPLCWATLLAQLESTFGCRREAGPPSDLQSVPHSQSVLFQQPGEDLAGLGGGGSQRLFCLTS